jgi:uncharacterized coiled-coil protein SlyX
MRIADAKKLIRELEQRIHDLESRLADAEIEHVLGTVR